MQIPNTPDEWGHTPIITEHHRGAYWERASTGGVCLHSWQMRLLSAAISSGGVKRVGMKLAFQSEQTGETFRARLADTALVAVG